MTTTSIRTWFSQVTTGAGIMVLVPTLLALLGHQITIAEAVPALAAGIVGLIWPENHALAAAVQAGAQQAVGAAPAAIATTEAILHAYRTGLTHGAIVPAPTPTTVPANVPASDAPTAPKLASIAGALGLLMAAGGLVACTTQQEQAVLATPAGQLFCAIETASGPLVVKAIDAEATNALPPGAAPVAVIATGAAKTYVDAVCAAAGGVPVSPPANPASAPTVAVQVPARSA